MKRTRSLATHVAAIGVAAVVIGAAVLAGTAVVAGATGSTGCASSCSLTATATTGLAPSAAVQVSGSGFTAKATGAVVECNLAPGEPTIAIPDVPGIISNLGSLPVGCSTPSQSPAKVAKGGTITDIGLGVITGTVGPPAVGPDSSGGDAATDAASYPCPPTQAQVASGVTCAFVFQDSAGENASLSVTFTTPYTTVTVPTTVAPPSGCTPASAQNSGGPPTVTVDPGTCLVGGEKVTVSGTGVKPSSLGSVLECNTATGEPTVFDATANQAIPVGCSNPLSTLISTSSSGTVPSTPFTILTGTIGPPIAGTDSAGVAAATDAANYPCPPTATQLAAGVTCAVIFGDLAGDQVVVPVSFGSNPGVTGNNPGGTTSATQGATTAAAKATATKASSGALAFTGTGTGLTALALAAVVLIIVGLVLLALADGRRLTMLWIGRRLATLRVRR